MIKQWFPSNVYNTHVCSYILENTWHKPRDIIRLLLSAQSKNSRNFSSFNQNTFETFMPVYSKQCLVEIKEELRALYTSEEIEKIFNCLQGFKSVFSFDEISRRAKKIFPNSVFSNDPYTVLNDMYRIGVIGNISRLVRSPRWEYKEQYKLYIDNPWKIIIHPSLRIELSLTGRANGFKSLTDSYENKDISTDKKEYTTFHAEIKEIGYSCIFVKFIKDGKNENGIVYFPHNNNGGVQLKDVYQMGEIVTVQIIEYDRKKVNPKFCVNVKTQRKTGQIIW